MNDKIIRTLKLYPEHSVAQVAELLNVNPKVVSEAQRAYYRRFIKCDSPLWGLSNHSATSLKALFKEIKESKQNRKSKK